MKKKFKALFVLAIIFASTCIGCSSASDSDDEEYVTKNAVLIIVDSFRYDALEKANMPYLQSCIAHGVGFKCVAGGNRTFDGFNAILTGKNVNEIDYNEDLSIKDSEILITEILKENNYETMFISACVGDKGFSIWNYQQGCNVFELYENIKADPWYLTGENYFNVVCNGLQKLQNNGKPKFIILHIAEPHSPYYSTGNTVLERYYNACTDSDTSIKNLMNALRENNITEENSFFIITGDHGEQLGEYGKTGHGHTMNDEEIIVPLIMTGGGYSIGYSDRVVTHIDVVPTILSNMYVRFPISYEGKNFLEHIYNAGKTTRNIKSINRLSDGTYDIRFLEVDY